MYNVKVSLLFCSLSVTIIRDSNVSFVNLIFRLITIFTNILENSESDGILLPNCIMFLEYLC